MTTEQWIIFGILLLTLILFIMGRWRYDVMALIALLAKRGGDCPLEYRSWAGLGMK